MNCHKIKNHLSKTTLISLFFLHIYLLPFSSYPHENNEPGFHSHDGFFLRMCLGLGLSVDSAEDEEGIIYRMKGISGNFDLALGGVLFKNLALHASIFDRVIEDPTIELGELSLLATPQDVKISMVAIGGGLTYYFMPSNIYLSLNLGSGKLNIHEKDAKVAETDFGTAMRISFGKEWWASANWGLGICGIIDFSSIPDQEGGPVWDGLNIGVLFSATYN